MEAVQKENWYFMALLISLSFLKDSEQLMSPGSTVTLRDRMMLDCSCPWSGNLIMVSWTKGGDSTPLAIYHPDYGVNFNTAYDGRVEFIHASKMDGSIRITNVTEKDEGVYHCSVQTFPHGSWTKDTLVQKQVTTTVVSHNLTTLIVSENEDVTISCSHDDAVYEVSVERIEGVDGGSRLLAVCKQNNDGVELSEYSVHREIVNCSDEMELKLHLNNMSEDESGIYRCNFSADAGFSSRLILLTMFPSPKGLSGAQNWWYIYTGGGVAGALVLMTIALLFMWRSRRKVRRLEYRTQLHTTKRQHIYTNEQGGVYDKMKKTTRNQRKNNPIYVNFQNTRAKKKGKR